ncbi:hypothetical protein G6F56_013865 [Rhizopus delemar]|nr:hypothetical protein G6F56_013865 [Rhizopus delemar]
MSTQNSNRSAKPAENPIPRILSMLNTLIEGQKSLIENQKNLQDTCENLTATVAEIKQALASNRSYSSFFKGQQQTSPSSVHI